MEFNTCRKYGIVANEHNLYLVNENKIKLKSRLVSTLGPIFLHHRNDKHLDLLHITYCLQFKLFFAGKC